MDGLPFTAVKANQRDVNDVVNRIENCLLEVGEWMDDKVLKPENRNSSVRVETTMGKVTLGGLNACDIIVSAQAVAKDHGGTLGFLTQIETRSPGAWHSA